jgi:rsbT co-antagonist protein RsbR
MSRAMFSLLAQTLADQDATILSEWLEGLRGSGLDQGRINTAELQTQTRSLLESIRRALTQATTISGEEFAPVREFLSDISRTRAIQGFSPRETASFVFSLKQPVFSALTRRSDLSTDQRAQAIWQASVVLDELGLITMDAFQRSREEVIVRQQREISELSTPVVKLWEGVLALPIIGTLDSERTQVVMENLLQSIVENGADLAIIDITGVPTVDTLTAQHLLKTIAAARLMGADCIISGIRPQIAQTMVHLGVELNVISKATLADAFALALRKLGKVVTTVKTPASSDAKGAA